MFTRFTWPWGIIALATLVAAQDGKRPLNARDLYQSSRDLKQSEIPGASATNLGIRYNVLLFDGKDALLKVVDPQRVFKTGECIALEFEANRDGYLYVLSEGASRQWTILVPSVIVSDEAYAVKAGTRLRVPVRKCIEFTEPAGIERLFLILTNEIKDVRELMDVYRASSLARIDQQPAGGEGPAVTLANHLRDRLASRDLKVVKIDNPEAADERPFTVYAVAPARRLLIEIGLSHE